MVTKESLYNKFNSIRVGALIVLHIFFILVILYLAGFSEIIFRESSLIFGFDEFSKKADSYPLSVHFIDVGNGDSILICFEEKTILIDTGDFSLDGKSKEYIEHKGIEKIDIFIATHMDSDHIGDFESIAENFQIGEVWLSENSINIPENKGSAEKSFFEIIKSKNIKTFYPKSESCKLGELVIDTFPPQRKYSEENDNSLVVRINYKNISYLLTGDAGTAAEKDMILSGRDIHSDILKLGHHGSKTATSEEFLKSVSPKYAVVSVGDDNKYLPNRDTIERTENFGAKILRTDIDGSIIIASDGINIKTFLENEEK